MDMNEILKQAQKLQEDMENAQKKLESAEVEVSSGGGAIKVKIKGSGKFTSVKIANQEILKDVAALEAAILTALNEAIEESRKKHEEAMKGITSGLNLPGMDDLIPSGPSGAAPTGRAKSRLSDTSPGMQV